MPRISREQLRKALATVDYPMPKTTSSATPSSPTPENRCKALRSLPPVDYGNFDEVLRSVKADIGSGNTATQHSDPQRLSSATWCRRGQPVIALESMGTRRSCCARGGS
jgi:hypothetical protein